MMGFEQFKSMMDDWPGEPHGAYPKGTRIMKVHGEDGDAHPLGTIGTVRGSVCHPETLEIGYLIEWDHGVMGFIIAQKIQRIAGTA